MGTAADATLSKLVHLLAPPLIRRDKRMVKRGMKRTVTSLPQLRGQAKFQVAGFKANLKAMLSSQRIQVLSHQELTALHVIEDVLAKILRRWDDTPLEQLNNQEDAAS